MTEPPESAGGVPNLDLTSERDGGSRDGSLPETPGTDEPAANETDAKGTGEAGEGSGEDDEVEPVELLVQLAEEGEIEPWDIDIVQVTDAFLEKLDETDLRTTGRALFYASVLLRMKSDGMLADDDGDDEEPEPEPWEVAMEGGAPDPADGDFDPIDELEAEMDRRLDRKNTRGSPETLDELVRELREAERGSWWKDSREYDTSESPHGHARGTQTLDYHTGDEFRRDGEPTAGEATDRTHDEDIEEVIVGIDNALRTQFDRGRTEVLFAEIETAGGRPFMTYLALLFMAHRGSVRLQQDDLFGDLWVKDPSAMAGESEAIAD
ncbi:segregation and condensation protein A [Halorubrum lacusprofundi]|jgi:segregation and condensation protein A|uniref:Chromosome segregation and condensation protein ScpA n=1 Tax=Halorubrum lacusprofundi (strain ATCC 49239 / DSM 5036 / JCM 8891 / ACAM 34) TaxID=416348 RepID=B9LTJ6_HALLT|nr:ScpA family protein [Halorubrum lacusprofundi]ACM56130.1 chromosome segregation and condensation protein ScpA [Halorubrum lacusprofundi ATCC 49239]MCG1005559.1 segregation/condensation protein A [Halorubrum lacusprofundi]